MTNHVDPGKDTWTLDMIAWKNIISFNYRIFFHQEFQVPKMEVLNLIRPFWGWVFPYISLTYSSYR